MSRNLRARSAQTFTENIDYRVKLYSLAAAGAGVSMLALAQPAIGEVVVTKKNIPLTEGRPVSIDLNKDGIADFQFSVTSFRSAQSSHLNKKETLKPLTGGAVVGGRLGSLAGPYASALVRGAKIGPSAHFGGGEVTIQRLSAYSSGGGRSYGNWPWSYSGTKIRFLGVKFLIKGETHYGWIRLAIGVGRSALPGNILGYAYETIANKRISAGILPKNSAVNQARESIQRPGQPGRPSLGMLAFGAEGLALWRREETLPSNA